MMINLLYNVEANDSNTIIMKYIVKEGEKKIRLFNSQFLKDNKIKISS